MTQSAPPVVHSHFLRSKIRFVALLAGCGLLTLALGIVAIFDPSTHQFFPPCVFHEVTGLYCPGCGSTRCLHSLLQGDIAAALGYNPLAVLAMPFLAVGLLLPTEKFRKWAGYPATGWTVFFVLLAFGLLRNLPAYPFNLLAP